MFSRKTVWFAVAFVSLALPARPASAQEPPRADLPSQQPTFRTGTNLVRVDVLVTDEDGHPMLDLAGSDFEVFEDGRRQTIQSFKLVQLSGEQAEAEEDESLPIRSEEHGRAEAAREDVRLFAIFLDDYHVARLRETIVVRDALKQFIRTQLGPRDLVALMDPLTPLSALRFTRDRDEVLRQIHAFEGRRGIYLPPRSAIEEQQLASGQVERIRAEVTLTALHALVSHLGSVREGRKSVIFVSGGFGIANDMWTSFREVYEAASQNNAAIYPLDPAGLGAGPGNWLDTLRMLADSSGGRAIVNVNRFDRPLEQVVRDASAYYLVGYASDQKAPDGRFHTIKVRVNRRGAEVRARKGFWAPTAEQAARAAVTTPEVANDVTRALAALATPPTGRQFDTWIGLDRGAPGRMRLAFAWEARPARPGTTSVIPAQLAVTVVDAEGREQCRGTAPARLADGAASTTEPSEPLTCELAAGPAGLRIEALDHGGAAIDVEERRVAVPDLWGTTVSLGTPRVLRARNGPQYLALAADARAPATPRREFRRTDRLLIRFAVYHTDGIAAGISARLLTRRGNELVTLPVGTCDASDATHQIDLPLAGVAPGEYVVRIDATVGSASAFELIPLRVE